jgi:phosphoglycolate phosphatase
MDAGKACMVGDRCFDIEAACALGLGAIGVNYGYALPGELIQSGADVVFDSVEELARYLLGEA